MPMHEVTPKVVAMAVSTVMMMWSILLQVFLFSMIFDFSSFLFVIQTTEGRKDLECIHLLPLLCVTEIFRTSPQQLVFVALLL